MCSTFMGLLMQVEYSKTLQDDMGCRSLRELQLKGKVSTPH